MDDFNIELTGFSTTEFDLMFDVESPEQDDKVRMIQHEGAAIAPEEKQTVLSQLTTTEDLLLGLLLRKTVGAQQHAMQKLGLYPIAAKSEVAMNTVICKAPTGNQYAKMHILADNEQILIVGNGEIPEQLRERLQNKRIHYVSQNAPDRFAKIDQKCSEIVKGKDMKKAQQMFLTRNHWVMPVELEEDKNAQPPSLSELLADPEKTRVNGITLAKLTNTRTT